MDARAVPLALVMAGRRRVLHAGVDWTPIRLAFFDHYLMDIDTGLMGADNSGHRLRRRRRDEQARRSSHLDHGGRWIDAPAWPLPDAKVTTFHLHEGGLLSKETPKAKKSSTSFAYDPQEALPAGRRH